MGLAFLITSDNLQLLSERKVLKEAEYAALLDAAQLVEAARSEADRLIREADALAARRHQEGYARGLQEGRAAQAAQLLRGAAEQERQLATLREAIASVVVQSVGQLLGEADPSHRLAQALRRVDELVREQPFMSLRVAPGEERVARSALEALQAQAGWASRVSVQADPSLAAGACVLSTAAGTLELGLDAQMAALRRATLDMAAQGQA
mgnify:CR=1 FL=1